MNFTNRKKTVSGQKYILLGILFIALTLLPIFVLSNLITELTEKANSDNEQRGVLKKQEILAENFSKLLESENGILSIFKISTQKNLSDHLKVFSAIQSKDSLITNIWFQTNHKKITFIDTEIKKSITKSIVRFITDNQDKKKATSIIKDGNNFYWRVFSETKTKDQKAIKYGYDIDLKSVHRYFSLLDKRTSNYAFIFDKKGTIVYHPDEKLLSKNTFKVTDLTPSDTLLLHEEAFNKKTGLSEYLKLDIVRYTKQFKLKDTNWYICINFAKAISNEDVDAVKKYASLIYLFTTIILVGLFLLFSRFSRKSFNEKKQLAREKNKLLLENEKVNKEKALIQLQHLKEQINPHFLFNSLNSLYMLIENDGTLAKKFTLNLSRIYRYLIDPPTENIVTLRDELVFIERYIFLQQTRFKDQLMFSIHIEDDTVLSKKVPYLSFQVVIENVFKHNVSSVENPLEIIINIKKNKVVIINNIQERRNNFNSTKFGHMYLESIYNFYAKHDFEVYQKDNFYTCILPLID